MTDQPPVRRTSFGDLTSTPQTRAEAYEDGVLEHTGRADEFLPLVVRRVLYLIAIAGLFAAPILAVEHPEYGAALITSSNGLGAVALGVALGNARR